MIRHKEIDDADLRKEIRRQTIFFGGNSKLKIYGTLGCRAGKRMKKENRVFFISEAEAIECGYRPCGHCMKKEYDKGKNGSF
ncbi:MAG: Metal binding domain of Ada [Bacteroidetes bacterium]|nr:Metal binding domain of Ada [Bacteroidota bacterium]